MDTHFDFASGDYLWLFRVFVAAIIFVTVLRHILASHLRESGDLLIDFLAVVWLINISKIDHTVAITTTFGKTKCRSSTNLDRLNATNIYSDFCSGMPRQLVRQR